METNQFNQRGPYEWEIEPDSGMRVPGVIFADRKLIQDMDQKVFEQVCNVAKLPGIVTASYAMPDAHWGYGFPIGGVAAFDPDKGGVISAGGVGFDISCGVRTLYTGLKKDDVIKVRQRLADILYDTIPAGIGSTGNIHLNTKELDIMLTGGAKWAVDRGYGLEQDLDRVEENGCMPGAQPELVSEHAKHRQRNEMGTLGSGNHYLEVQIIQEIFDHDAALVFGIAEDEILISIHCGSRGLGHQIGTEFLKLMVKQAGSYGIMLPDRELACAPIHSSLGKSYLGAMRAGINCALANRQILTHLTRTVMKRVLPQADLRLLYDVSHNTCKLESHIVNGKERQLFIHRKGATRAYGPGHIDVPESLRTVGQPVLIGGTMGTASYILVGTKKSEQLAFSSACHGAGRSMSRNQARKQWQGRKLIDELNQKGILIRSPSFRGVAEEAPGAYKDVEAVVDAADRVGIARKVAKLTPMICIKG